MTDYTIVILLLALAVAAFFVGMLVSDVNTHERLVKSLDTDHAMPTRAGYVHIVSSERYRELRCRESHYFRFKRRYEQQDKCLDD